MFIASLLSSRGGSFYILTELDASFTFYINQFVFREMLVVLDRKFNNADDVKQRMFLFLGSVPIHILPDPTKRTVNALSKIIEKEDAPILASASMHTDYLITLDSDFLKGSVLDFSKKKNLVILSPKDFIFLHRNKK